MPNVHYTISCSTFKCSNLYRDQEKSHSLISPRLPSKVLPSIPPQSSSHSVYTQVGITGCVVAFTSDKRFGLVDLGERKLDENIEEYRRGLKSISYGIHATSSNGLSKNRKRWLHVYGHTFKLTVQLCRSITHTHTHNHNEVRYLWKQSRICSSTWYEAELSSTPHRFLSRAFQHVVGTLRYTLQAEGRFNVKTSKKQKNTYNVVSCTVMDVFTL
jgi:hypothetical protein